MSTFLRAAVKGADRQHDTRERLARMQELIAPMRRYLAEAEIAAEAEATNIKHGAGLGPPPD